MIRPSVQQVSVDKYLDGTYEHTLDLLTVEEPLEIRLVHYHHDTPIEVPIAVTMRTPGHDEELALGFLITEGIIDEAGAIKHIRHCERTKSQDEKGNVLIVTLQESISVDISKLKRNFYTTSSCGVCGKESIEAIKSVRTCTVSSEVERISANIVLNLSDTLRSVQQHFKYTGGIHAVAFYDSEGQLLVCREDVGRHNAMDKAAGVLASSAIIRGKASIALLSGRASFELLQKAAMVGIRMVCAIGAPSTLAVATAKAFGITLVGFIRDNKFNIYHEGSIIINRVNGG